MSAAPPPELPGPRGPKRRGCLIYAMFAGAVLAALLVLVVGLAALLTQAPPVPEGSILVVGTERPFPEALPYAPMPFADVGPSFGEMVRLVGGAADDSRISGLHLRIGGPGLGLAGARELRQLAARFRENGKRVTAALERAGLLGYYLATAADRIHLHPRGELGLFGVSFEAMFLADLFEELGIEAQFEAIGPWKTAPETYTRSGMSEAQRGQLTGIAAGFRAEVTDAVAEARGLDGAEAAGILADGPYTADHALALGLVDALSYRDELEDDLLGAPRLDLRDYARSRGFGLGGSVRNVVAVVHVDGAILPGESLEDLVLGKVAGAATVADALIEARDDPAVAAIVLRVSSPGGVDTAAETIWRAAVLAGEEKPLVASFGDTAASGGYWVATAAPHIVADPFSLTGSIGVFAGKFSVGRMLGKVGVGMEVVSSGGNPDWLSPARPLDEEDLSRLRQTIRETYEVFLDRVADARGMTPAEVEAVAAGRVFTGRQAVEAGLVDDLGGLLDAVRFAATEAGLPDDVPPALRFLPHPPTLFEALEARFRSGGGLREAARRQIPLLRAMGSGARMALLPFRPAIR